MTDAPKTSVQPNVTLWSRGGFLGASAVTLQPGYTPDYVSVQGAHAPRRLVLSRLDAPDRADPTALPLTVLTSAAGAAIGLSRRREAMPFVFRNVECDELHFIQSGSVRFDTEFGAIEAAEDDFVFIPRSVAYRTVPLSEDLLALIVESPQALDFDLPTQFGMVNMAMDVRRAAVAPPTAPPSAAPPPVHELILKARDGLTRFLKPTDPLFAVAHIAGDSPVWALNLRKINPVSFGGMGGAPAHFLAAPGKAMLVFTLSSRASKMRAPVHHNADYDEIIIYTRGPGAYGAADEPGTLMLTPKGVTHHGPSEDVPEGYLAWLIETHSTMRFTPEALAAATLMETGLYGVHPSVDAT